MNVLMLAPEPFFQPRGTPISVYFRIQALSELNHRVDLITSPLGEDVENPNLEVHRIPNLLGLKRIKIGPSFIKLPLDFLMFWKAFSRLAGRRYDLIFSHEEAAFLGVILGKIWKVPHLYDMHSSLPQQLENFDFSRSRLLKKAFTRMERFILKHSQAVIVICQDLRETVKREGFESKTVLIENFLDFPGPAYSEDKIRAKRKELAPGGEKIVLYAGNFQPYQGIALLLEAAAKVGEKARFLFVGGSPTENEEMGEKAEALGIRKKVVFVDRVAPSQVPLYISLADVLVSPRLSGTNTPLKIYSFLKSGKPVVATRLWTHTQILDDKISVLVEPDPEHMARGISFALFNEDARRRAETARFLAEKEYTPERYLEKIRACLEIARSNFKTGKSL
jgi:glycosyltransferase involved in cell wall biosynthesis